LIEFLTAKPLELPSVAPTTSAALEAGQGTVTPSFERGELFLANEDGQAFRISWMDDESAQERRRTLPAGKYVLKTYRIVRRKQDELWHISATRPAIMDVEVTAGENVTVEVSDAIRVNSRRNGSQAQMSIQGESEAGLSIYRDGRRIRIDYRVLDADDTLLASGRMRYG